jgi:yecA family protein
MEGDTGMEAEYQQVDAALRAVEAQTAAAEAQGLLCGMASASNRPDKAAWIAQVLADTEPRGEAAKHCLAVLVGLYDRTLRELDDDGMRFEPLLPDDGVPLSERTQALGRWASGFLAGMGLGGLKQETPLPADVAEALRDLDAISQIELDAVGDEDDEAAYAELAEYVKVAVLLVRAHLRQPAAPTRDSSGKRLH